jgi:phosphomannomutase
LNKAKVFRSPVGEINVVKEMMKNKSVIGGEGSGGVIFPALHYGRDSLVGIVLVLNELAEYKYKLSDYKKTIPEYFISKSKVENINDPDILLNRLKNKFSKNKEVIKIWTNDGLKIDFKNYWVHLRKSNTEPILRIITEAKSKKEADDLQIYFSDEISKVILNPR